MIAAVKSEVRKLTTTRLWWILTVVMAGYMAIMAVALAAALAFGGISTSMPDGTMGVIDSAAMTSAIYGLAPSMGYIFPLIVGTLAFTGEFRYKTLTPTFLADPNRTRVLIAKCIANLAMGIMLGVVAVAACLVPAATVLAISGTETGLGDASTWANAGLAVLALGIWAVVGVGVGAMIPNQIAAVVVLLAFTQLVEPILRIVGTLVSGLSGVAKFLPGAASEALSGGNSIYSASGLTGAGLSTWQGGLMLVAYAVAFALIGRLTTLRRDIA